MKNLCFVASTQGCLGNFNHSRFSFDQGRASGTFKYCRHSQSDEDSKCLLPFNATNSWRRELQRIWIQSSFNEWKFKEGIIERRSKWREREIQIPHWYVNWLYFMFYILFWLIKKFIGKKCTLSFDCVSILILWSSLWRLVNWRNGGNIGCR